MTTDRHEDLRHQILAALEQIPDRPSLSIVAKRMGVAPNTISVMLHRTRRHHEPKIESITRYAEALGVDITYSAHLTMPDGTSTVVDGSLTTKDQA